MQLHTNNSGRGAFATLQRFVRRPTERVERCELCAAQLPADHAHLLELQKRQVTCACEACAILFSGNTKQRYRRIPRDVVRLHNFLMSDQEWDSLLIPINLAFFVREDEGRTVAQYPSPGGAMESLLDLEYWNEIVERNPVLRRFESDVEALLVQHFGHLFEEVVTECLGAFDAQEVCGIERAINEQISPFNGVTGMNAQGAVLRNMVFNCKPRLGVHHDGL